MANPLTGNRAQWSQVCAFVSCYCIVTVPLFTMRVYFATRPKPGAILVTAQISSCCWLLLSLLIYAQYAWCAV